MPLRRLPPVATRRLLRLDVPASRGCPTLSIDRGCSRSSSPAPRLAGCAGFWEDPHPPLARKPRDRVAEEQSQRRPSGIIKRPDKQALRGGDKSRRRGRAIRRLFMAPAASSQEPGGGGALPEAPFDPALQRPARAHRKGSGGRGGVRTQQLTPASPLPLQSEESVALSPPHLSRARGHGKGGPRRRGGAASSRAAKDGPPEGSLLLNPELLRKKFCTEKAAREPG